MVFSNSEFTSANGFAQKSRLDVLNTGLKNSKHDITRANIYNRMADEFYVSKIDTISSFCEKVIEICDRNIAAANAYEKRSFIISKSLALNIGYVHYSKGNTIAGFHFSFINVRAKKQACGYFKYLEKRFGAS
jgi:hypothetical protein